jgi:hypothetical protein
MSIEVDVRVVDEDGEGVAGARVYMSYPFTWQEDHTDSDGWVHFERSGTMHGGVRTDIFINGEKVADDVWIEGEESFSFTI